MAVFCWSVYNGATYYIDVFGKRFQNELEAMKKEVLKWQNSPDMMSSPLMTPRTEGGGELNSVRGGELNSVREKDGDGQSHERSRSVDKIPLLNDGGSTGMSMDGGAKDVAREHRAGDLPQS